MKTIRFSLTTDPKAPNKNLEAVGARIIGGSHMQWYPTTKVKIHSLRIVERPTEDAYLALRINGLNIIGGRIDCLPEKMHLAAPVVFDSRCEGTVDLNVAVSEDEAKPISVVVELEFEGD